MVSQEKFVLKSLANCIFISVAVNEVKKMYVRLIYLANMIVATKHVMQLYQIKQRVAS